MKAQFVCRSSTMAKVMNATQAIENAMVRAMNRPYPLMWISA
jgi:hypothetical protein